MAYRHNDTLHKHKKRETRFRKFAFFATSIAVIIVMVITVDWVLSRFSNSNTVVSRENTTSVQSANVSVYRTEFFQFQAPEEWVAVASETTEDRYVYVKNDGQLITQRLLVFIDRPAKERASDFRTTNVIPVKMSELGKFSEFGKVSEHCNSSFPDDGYRDPRRITHVSVSVVCNPDSREYNVVVAEVEGDEAIEAIFNDGKEHTITIVYSDLTAYPNPGDVYNILSSFNIL